MCVNMTLTLKNDSLLMFLLKLLCVISLFYARGLLAEECEHTSLDCGHGEAEFLVKHLVGCRCSEVVETKHFAVGSHDSAECGGQTGCETEGGDSGGENGLTIFEGLVAEDAD